MYNRSYGQRRPPRIPQNYAGNAFNSQVNVPPPPPQMPPEPPEEGPTDFVTGSTNTQGGIFALPAPPAQVPDEAFGPKESSPCERCESTDSAPHPLLQKGLGDEELLILALILLLSQGEGSCSSGEVIPFLVLLLFC